MQKEVSPQSEYVETLNVLVGPEEQLFTVHKDAICHKSPFFAAACSTQWAEHQDGTVRLQFVEPNTFKLYIHWVYTAQLDISIIELPFYEKLETQPQKHPAWEATCLRIHKASLLCKTYVAADVLLDRHLKNEVIDQLLGLSTYPLDAVSEDYVNYIWSNTHVNSGIRRCIADYLAPTTSARDAKVLSREALVDLVARLIELRDYPDLAYLPGFSDRCKYHEHVEGEKRCTP
ncbi:hypothetical protein LTR37_012251 [Vermiconidia calcicola]|uniref:Uncharacterized protein n=1 Tax=Vermiconidia calcicola TaxID=1690605 RepID=A0ACC3MZT9_9PEZI|nr:hypothetical protein LTR37_012251 [Vermiconidia calcicola]